MFYFWELSGSLRHPIPPHPHPLVSFSFFSPSSAIFLLVVVVDVFCFYFAGASLLRYRWCRRGSFRTMCVSFDSTKRNEMRRGTKNNENNNKKTMNRKSVTVREGDADAYSPPPSLWRGANSFVFDRRDYASLKISIWYHQISLMA